MQNDYPTLADAIAQIRRELINAEEEGKESGVKFVAQQVELEFEVQVEKTGGADGGLRIGVISLGAKES